MLQNLYAPKKQFAFTIVVSVYGLVSLRGRKNLNNDRQALTIQRILSKETGRKLVMGGVMLLVIGFIFLVSHPQLTYYRVIGIVGAVELFIGLVIYQTYSNPKVTEVSKLQ